MVVKQPTNIFDFDAARQEQIADYAIRREVLGVEDVHRGARVAYPTTIYNVSGDDTSGVAGLLMADGEYRPAAASRVGEQELYWEFDETLGYEKVPGEKTPEGTPRVVGNSWTTGEVVWDGSVVGQIDQHALDGDEESHVREVVKRRTHDNSLTGEWQSTGELYKAMERGTKMYSGPVPGHVHAKGGEDTDGGYWVSENRANLKRVA
jgi:hypothetical protein